MNEDILKKASLNILLKLREAYHRQNVMVDPSDDKTHWLEMGRLRIGIELEDDETTIGYHLFTRPHGTGVLYRDPDVLLKRVHDLAFT